MDGSRVPISFSTPPKDEETLSVIKIVGTIMACTGAGSGGRTIGKMEA